LTTFDAPLRFVSFWRCYRFRSLWT